MLATPPPTPPGPRGAALQSFNETATVMRFLAQNQVHVNGAFRL